MSAAATAPAEKPRASEARAGRESGIPVSGIEDARWAPAFGLPCQLSVDLPLPNFKVGDFLKLQAGSVVDTQWRLTRDVPLRINGTLVGWGEFEGGGSRLAVRLTELA